jgi:hypothetical protein
MVLLGALMFQEEVLKLKYMLRLLYLSLKGKGASIFFGVGFIGGEEL